MQNGRFPSESALVLKKVCYKVYLCENCQQQSCKAFAGLSIHAKIVASGRTLLVKMLPKETHPLQKRGFPIDILSWRLSRKT